MAKKNHKPEPSGTLRDKFLFYHNYYKVVKFLPDAVRLEVYDAICKTSFYGQEPKLSEHAESAFCLMRFGIKKSLINYRNKVYGKQTLVDEETGEVLTESKVDTQFDTKFDANETIIESKNEINNESNIESSNEVESKPEPEEEPEKNDLKNVSYEEVYGEEELPF